MVTLSLIKEAKIYNGEKAASSISGAGKTGYHMQENEIGPGSYARHKNHQINSRCIKDLDERPGTIRLLEKNIGEKLPT